MYGIQHHIFRASGDNSKQITANLLKIIVQVSRSAPEVSRCLLKISVTCEKGGRETKERRESKLDKVLQVYIHGNVVLQVSL